MASIHVGDIPHVSLFENKVPQPHLLGLIIL